MRTLVNKVEKVLGILWDSDKDILVYDFKGIMKDAYKSKPIKKPFENCITIL